VAGRKTYDTAQLHHVVIEENKVINAGQGIHVELCADVTIRNNQVSGASARWARLNDCGGIIVYECNGVNIDGNQVADCDTKWAIACLYGYANGKPTEGNRLVHIYENSLINAGSVGTCSPIRKTADEVDVRIEGNKIAGGGIIHRGPGTVVIANNKIARPPDTAITLSFQRPGSAFAGAEAVIDLTVMGNNGEAGPASVMVDVPCEYLTSSRFRIGTDVSSLAARFSMPRMGTNGSVCS
jgi:parallel beta-helix repeat protein